MSTDNSLKRDLPRLALIAGPTASGKSDLAIRLASTLAAHGRHPVIVNADSAQVYANQGTETGAAAQAILTTVRRAVTASPLIPGLKSLIARLHDDPTWRNIRPPHLKLDPQGEHALFANFDATGVVLTPPA